MNDSDRLVQASQWFLTYALAAVFLGFGAAKFSAMAGQGIAPLVMNSPLVSWWHGVFGIDGTARMVGIVELATGLLIAARPVHPRLSMIGGAMAVSTFVVTLSFLFSTPGATEGKGLTMLGEFLIKDLVLLAAGAWIFSTSRAELRAAAAGSTTRPSNAAGHRIGVP